MMNQQNFKFLYKRFSSYRDQLKDRRRRKGSKDHKSNRLQNNNIENWEKEIANGKKLKMSSSSKNYQVKVYHIENHSTKEIRKFSIEDEVAGNFEYVGAKIRRLFPSLLRKDLQVFWKGRYALIILL